MPMYEYRCEDCGENFEVIVRFADADKIQPCPNCGATRTFKKISATAAIGFSGGGGSAYSTGSSCGSGGGFT